MRAVAALLFLLLSGCALRRQPAVLPSFVPAQLEPGKLNVNLSIIPNQAAVRMTNKHFAKNVSIWTVSLANLTASDTAALGEGAVIDRIPELQPHGLVATLALAGDAQANSLVSWLAKLGEDALLGILYAANHDGLRGSWPVIAADLEVVGPYLLGRLKNHERPVMQDINLLAWAAPVKLAPGDTATRYLFTRRWADEAPPRHFVIETAGIPAVKLVHSQSVAAR